MNKYKVLIDYGKPFEEELTEVELKQKLKELREMAESGEYAYIDLDVIDKNGNYLTEEQINKIEDLK